MTESSVKNISIVSRSLEAKLIIDWLVSLGGQKNILQQSRFQSKKMAFFFYDSIPTFSELNCGSCSKKSYRHLLVKSAHLRSTGAKFGTEISVLCFASHMKSIHISVKNKLDVFGQN